MGSKKTIYVMTKQKLAYLINIKNIFCFTCEKPFEVNKTYVSQSRESGRRKIRCYECAKRVGVI